MNQANLDCFSMCQDFSRDLYYRYLDEIDRCKLFMLNKNVGELFLKIGNQRSDNLRFLLDSSIDFFEKCTKFNKISSIEKLKNQIADQVCLPAIEKQYFKNLAKFARLINEEEAESSELISKLPARLEAKADLTMLIENFNACLTENPSSFERYIEFLISREHQGVAMRCLYDELNKMLGNKGQNSVDCEPQKSPLHIDLMAIGPMVCDIAGDKHLNSTLKFTENTLKIIENINEEREEKLDIKNLKDAIYSHIALRFSFLSEETTCMALFSLIDKIESMQLKSFALKDVIGKYKEKGIFAFCLHNWSENRQVLRSQRDLCHELNQEFCDKNFSTLEETLELLENLQIGNMQRIGAFWNVDQLADFVRNSCQNGLPEIGLNVIEKSGENETKLRSLCQIALLKGFLSKNDLLGAQKICHAASPSMAKFLQGLLDQNKSLL